MTGSSGFAPLKALDEKALAEGRQRFRFIPLHERLASASARPAALPTPDYALNLEGVSPDDTSFSHFSTALSAQSDDNLTAAFVTYNAAVYPLSLSLPLVFRNRLRILDASLDALSAPDAAASAALCIAALARDLGPSHFDPFFTRVIAATAAALNPRAKHDDSVIDVAIFWQPDAVLLPLFAMVTDITKALLPHLISRPVHTVADLAPVLAHPQYRVREMAGEATLGYLIRKARDASARNALIHALMHSPLLDASDTPAQSVAWAADGLGVSLYESVRLPTGRLHSRAKDVLTEVLSALATTVDERSSKIQLDVVARCVASLCRHVSAAPDAQLIAALLLAGGDPAPYALFLLRKWLQFGGKPLVTLLGIPLCQRVLNAATAAVDRRATDPRAVCEAIGVLGSVFQFAPHAFREKSVHKAFTAALDRLAKGRSVDALSAGLCAVLDDAQFAPTPALLNALTSSVASLCNRLVALRPAAAAFSLHAALQYFRLLAKGHAVDGTVATFRAPLLEKQVVVALAAKADASGSPQPPGTISFSHALEHMSHVRITKCASALHARVTHCDTWSLSDCANFLTACAHQVDDVDDEHTICRMRGCCETVLLKKLLANQDAWATTGVCAAVAQCVKVFGLGIITGSKPKARKHAGESLLTLEAIVRCVSINLSSVDSKLRVASVSLLALLDIPSTDSDSDGAETRVEVPEDADVQVYVHHLRLSLQSPIPSLGPICSAFMYVMRVTRSLGGIGSRCLLVQEMARLVRQADELPESVIFLLTHFATGLFYISLKPLWEHVGELVRVVAAKNTKFVMPILLDMVRKCEDALLSTGSAEEEEDAEEELDDEISDGEDDDDADVVMEEVNKKSVEENIAEDENDLMDDEAPKDDDPAPRNKRKRKRPMAPLTVTKRQKQKMMEKNRLHWDSTEWKGFLLEDWSVAELSHYESVGMLDQSTDSLTVISEIIRALSKEPKLTTKYRTDIISSYFRLSPTSFSRNKGNHLAICFTILLEKMGGLKCCEANKDLEARMRQRLLSDICRNNTALQSVALRCLCVSRSPSVKQHRDSFLRLIDESSFREELTLMTEADFLDWNLSEDSSLTEGEEAMLDVILRICFSKMTGKKAIVNSRKSVVLSFITSKLPWKVSLPKMTALILEPIHECVTELESNAADDFIPQGPMPVNFVRHGLMNSIEMIVKHCRHTLPAPCWTKVTLAVVLFLQKAGSSSSGKSMRSKGLKLLAQMFLIRAEETGTATMRIMATMKATAAAADSGMGVSGTPALLKLISAVFTTSSEPAIAALLAKNDWVMDFCCRVIQSPDCAARPVDLVCDAASRLLTYVEDNVEQLPRFADALNRLALAFSVLFTRLMDTMHNNRSAQRHWSATFGRALGIVEHLLSIQPRTGSLLLDLADRLGAFLQDASLSNVSLESSLRTLSAILRTTAEHGTDRESTVSVAQLLPLLSNRRFLRNDNSYRALCDLIATVGTPDLGAVADTLKKLNAMSTSRLDDLDLDSRIEALNNIIALFKTALGGVDDGERSNTRPVVLKEEGLTLTTSAVVALFHGCLASVYVPDTAIRGSGGYAIRLISRWSAFANGQPESTGTQSIIYKVLHEALISSKKLSHRREICNAFGEFVRTFDGFSDDNSEWDGESFFNHFKHLSNASDMETDLFENLVHLQPHRRGRALRQIEKHIRKASSDEEVDIYKELKESLVPFSSVFAAPFALQVALERPDMDEQKKRKNVQHYTAREEAQKDVAVWAVELVGTAASTVDWHDYKRCIDNLLRRVSRRRSDEENVDDSSLLFKLLVNVAEAFPRSGQARYPDEKVAVKYLVNVLFPKMLRHISVGATNDLLHHQEKTQNTVVVVNSGKRKEKVQNSFRASIAIALGKLMVQLPEEHLETLMPLLVTPLTSALRSRMLSIRDSAKKALVSVTLSLGQKYFNFILQQVLGALNEGYKKEVCIYVIHALLLGIEEHRRETGEPFPIDECLDIIVERMVQELRGGASETRRDFEDPNASDTRMKQASARASKAYECAGLLGELISFKDSARSLCNPFLNVYARSPSTKLIGRIDQLMQKVLAGLIKNQSMTVESAFQFCYQFVSVKDDNERANGSKKDVANTAKKDNAEGNSMKDDDEDDDSDSDSDDEDEVVNKVDELKKMNTSTSVLGQPRWVNFGLQLLNSVLAKNPNIWQDSKQRVQKLLSMVQPFLSLCVAALKTGEDDSTLISFRVLQKVLKLGVKGKAKVAKEISNVIIDVLSYNSGGKAGSGNYSETNELFNTCLRAGAILLKEVDNEEFNVVSKAKVDALLSIACSCIESGSSVESRSSAIALLKCVIGKKIVLPSVYDMIEKVNRLIIHSQNAALTTSCIQMSIQFMCNYPLGEKRVRQHIEFFVRNISYERPSGRLASLQTIKEMIVKFPNKMINKEGEYLFIAITATIARDDDEACRAMAFDCIKGLFVRLADFANDKTYQSEAKRKITQLLKISATLVGVDGLQWSMTKLSDSVACKRMDQSEEHQTVRRCGFASFAAACKSGRLSALQLKLVLKVTVHALRQLCVEDERDEDEDENAGGEQDNDGELNSTMKNKNGWETWFVALQCVENIFEASKVMASGLKLEIEGFTQVMWKDNVIRKCLLHRHQWVRLVAARLVGSHLSACGGRKWTQSSVSKQKQKQDISNSNNENEKWMVWYDNQVTREWIKACCLQLEADHLLQDLGKQCLKNLVCMADVVRVNPSIGDISDMTSANVNGRPLDDDEDTAEMGELSEMMSGGEEEGENEKKVCDDDNDTSVGAMLRWVIMRMCGIAIKGGHEEKDFLRRGCALRFMLVSVTWWGKQVILPFLRQYTYPVAKILESGQVDNDEANGGKYKHYRRGKGKGRRDKKKRGGMDEKDEEKEDDEEGEGEEGGMKGLKTIAEGVQSALVECVGTEDYYKTYHEVRRKIAAGKNERKRRAAVMTAIDGERAAKKKRLKRLKKKGKSGRGTGNAQRYMGDRTGNTDDNIERSMHERRMLTDGL